MPAVPVVPGFGIDKTIDAAEPAPARGIAPSAFENELLTRAAAARRRSAEQTTVTSTKATPLRGSEAASALASAFQGLFGQAPSPELLSTLVAQWSHETGGGSAMMNYNFGGLKGKSPDGLSAAYRTFEGSGKTRRELVDHFRAYRTPVEGAKDYLTLLQTHFPAALEAARAGDTAGFVHGLKQGGYFTDSEETYARSVGQLAQKVITRGYDAVSHASHAASHPTPVEATATRTNVVDAYGLGQGPDALRAVDTLALADEISRAALRIASAGVPDREDERW